MITSFFKTTKPFHFVLVTFLSFMLFVFYRKNIILDDLSFMSLIKNFGVYIVLIFTISVQQFLVSKNNLTQRSSFSILFFVLFLAIIPTTLLDNNTIFANVFIVLALRRLVSLKSNIAVNKKLFDAALWIGVASLFQFWAILFFPLIFVAILFFALGQIKNWIIPYVALITIAIVVNSYSILFHNEFFNFYDYLSPVSFDISGFNEPYLVYGVTIILSTTIWAVFFYINKLRAYVRIKRTSFVLILYALLIALAIIVVSPEKNGKEFLFLFTPLAIIATNYLEAVEDKWFSEVFLWLLMLSAIAVLMLQLNAIG